MINKEHQVIFTNKKGQKAFLSEIIDNEESHLYSVLLLDVYPILNKLNDIKFQNDSNFIYFLIENVLVLEIFEHLLKMFPNDDYSELNFYLPRTDKNLLKVIQEEKDKIYNQNIFNSFFDYDAIYNFLTKNNRKIFLCFDGFDSDCRINNNNLHIYMQRMLNNFIYNRSTDILSVKMFVFDDVCSWRTRNGNLISCPHDYTQLKKFY